MPAGRTRTADRPRRPDRIDRAQRVRRNLPLQNKVRLRYTTVSEHMPATPVEVTLELTPRTRFDIIDVRERLRTAHGDLLDVYTHHLYQSFHTTAGYLEQSLAARLTRDTATVAPYVEEFRTMFPEGARYEHDQLERRQDLTSAERAVAPRNAHSHLAFMAAGLSTGVSHVNRSEEPVCFVDLDGVTVGRPRRRLTSIVGLT